jgi:hypothetical protein
MGVAAGAALVLHMGSMKLTAGLMVLAMAGMALAHEGHEHAPVGKVLTVAVKTGGGSHSYETVPGWGVLPDGKQIGPTHGGSAKRHRR